MMVRKYLKKKEKRKRHSAVKYNNMKQNWISYYNNFFLIGNKINATTQVMVK